MKKLVILCMLALTGCDVTVIYPGDARHMLIDGVCVSGQSGDTLTFTGDALTVSGDIDFTAVAVGATGNEVLYKITESSTIAWGELVFAPSINAITFMRVVMQESARTGPSGNGIVDFEIYPCVRQ